MTFGEKLKTLRKEHGYSQEDFAQHLDVSRQAVSKWESDRGMPETEKLLQISTIFGVTLDYLLKEENPESNVVGGGYYVSHEMITGYLSYKRQGAKRIAIGVSLILLSNLFGSFFEYGQVLLLAYWLTIAIGVAILIWQFFQPKRYPEIGEKDLLFDEKTLNFFRTMHEKNRKKYVFMIISGVILLILTPQITLISGNYFDYTVSNGLFWIFLAAWASLFILAGIAIHSEQIITQNTQYMARKKKRKKDLK